MLLGMVPLRPARLVEIRTALGLSQERMARLLDVSFASVNRWEGGGHSAPTGATLDLYRALDEALRAGHRPERLLAAAGRDRGQFLYTLFSLAYGRRKVRT